MLVPRGPCVGEEVGVLTSESIPIRLLRQRLERVFELCDVLGITLAIRANRFPLGLNLSVKLPPIICELLRLARVVLIARVAAFQLVQRDLDVCAVHLQTMRLGLLRSCFGRVVVFVRRRLFLGLFGLFLGRGRIALLFLG